jgi:pimeloyl-ACP methyl ester carboxylesterase
MNKLTLSLLGIFIFLTFQISGQVIEPGNKYGSNSEKGQYACIGDLQLYYEIYGNGSPLLLIHGGLGSIDEFENNIQDLSQKFKVICVDSRGYGRSNNPVDSLSYEQMADDMLDLLDYLKIDSSNIAGFSDGGVIGLYIASKSPGRVIKVFAAGANYLVEGLDSKIFAENMMSPENVKQNQFWISFREKYKLLNPNPSNFDSHIQLVRKMWLRDPYIPYADFLKISKPVLLIYGDKDSIRLEHGLQMYRLLNPKITQLCILPNSSHFVFSQKSKEVNALIINFMQ